MGRKLSWILFAFMLCSLVTWGSAFTPGVPRPQVGRREIAPKTEQVCCERSDVLRTLDRFPT